MVSALLVMLGPLIVSLLKRVRINRFEIKFLFRLRYRVMKVEAVQADVPRNRNPDDATLQIALAMLNS